ncbi:hypothetical protein DFH06DRAFT_1122030 [Mycena polygramma]|nr:hypothetical protein DFH06DRAFT_1122030 [Mycena polygramma]
MTRLHDPDDGTSGQQDLLSSFHRLNLDSPAPRVSPAPRRFAHIDARPVRSRQTAGSVSLPPPPQPPSLVPPPYATVNPERPAAISPARAPRNTEYHVVTPTQSVSTTEWSVAGGLTQGVPGAAVRASKKKKKRRPPAKAYIVFCGKQPGLSLTWAEARQYVDGVPNAIYRGYRNVPIAEAAFIYAVERSWTRVSDSTIHAPIPALPHPMDDASRDNPLHASEALDDTWYIVYRGICPGVYRSHLECQLNTMGVRRAVHESVEGKDFAFAKYARARAARLTEYLMPTYHPDVVSIETDPFL